MDKIETPSLMLFFAKKFVGKTTLMRYLLYKFCQKKRFDFVIVVSPTGAMNGNWDCVPKNKLYKSFDEGKINAMLDLLQEASERGEPLRACLVLDDVLGSVRLQAPIWDKLATTARQYGLTIMMSAQWYHKVPTVIRSNAEYIFVLKTAAKRTFEGLYEDFASNYFDNIEEWKQFASKNTDNYRSVLINNKTPSNNKAEAFFLMPAPPARVNFKIEC